MICRLSFSAWPEYLWIPWLSRYWLSSEGRNDGSVAAAGVDEGSAAAVAGCSHGHAAIVFNDLDLAILAAGVFTALMKVVGHDLAITQSCDACADLGAIGHDPLE